ncbi:hypothetical protein [Ferruginibacter sp.]|nr:hypothetical protein [Ferruginibacter sp.]
MQSQVVNQYTKTKDKKRFNQGDILKDISLFVLTGSGELQVSEINLEYAIVVSQDCDLEHDYNNRNNPAKKDEDKFLPNILLLPAYLATKFRTGEHRGDEIKGLTWGSDKWKLISQNNEARFHFISQSEDYQIPELVLDFKHLYTIDRDMLYNKMGNVYLASICELYRELLSQRYSNFLGRIGLPEISS